MRVRLVFTTVLPGPGTMLAHSVHLVSSADRMSSSLCQMMVNHPRYCALYQEGGEGWDRPCLTSYSLKAICGKTLDGQTGRSLIRTLLKRRHFVFIHSHQALFSFSIPCASCKLESDGDVYHS